MAANPIATYLQSVQTAVEAGTATEHTHRPALKTLLQALVSGITATNEPKHLPCGAPDYVITRAVGADQLTVGYVEAKDTGKLYTGIEKSDQMRRYLRALPNLLLTDYLEFRWFVDGELRNTARLARLGPGGKLVKEKDGVDRVGTLLTGFLGRQPEPIGKPEDLARRMARLTHIIRDTIVESFEEGAASSLLKGWRAAFAQVLIADLDQPVKEKTVEFADMFAQTLAYGLFSARVMDTTPGFTRDEARKLIPRTNPFLRDFFEAISGNKLDDEPFAPFVDDLVSVLGAANMDEILAQFGKRTRQEDPVVHFYETFLAAYDPKLREARGVYYTPEPVVSYIVRSVDHLLRERFGCPAGLADDSKIVTKGKPAPGTPKDSHRVLVLDPATGTATFLYAVIDLIRTGFMEGGNAGLWSGYVRDSLLPRLFGFELLMAPYAVAHFKLGLQLAGRDLPPAGRATWAYDFAADERLGIYLTNALEGPHEYTGLPLFTQFLADETNAANRIKQDLPIMVVLGNPPYSGHSSNKGDWIRKLVQDYYFVDGQPLGERNPKWLQDDYVKFIRFGQWRIERSGGGILAFISNNGYLDNPTFRGMRQSLMNTFSDIYLLNLHGNSKKGDRAPDGSADENVFDIQQGVAIALFVKQPAKKGPARVHYADLWGEREGKDKDCGKYPWLFAHDVTSTDWTEVAPQPPFYLFMPDNVELRPEYEQGWKVTDVFPTHGWGIATRKDYLLVDFSRDVLVNRFRDIRSLSPSAAIAKYGIKEAPHWDFTSAKKQLAEDTDAQVHHVLFRPFDFRFVYYEKCMIERGDHRFDLMSNMFQDNKSLITVRRAEGSDTFRHFYCTSEISVLHSTSAKEGNFVFPLYLYPSTGKQASFADQPTMAPGGRRPNLSPAFIAALAAKLGLTFVPDGQGDLQTTFGPEDVFHYIYAVFHAPTYRSRYAEFLKIDFPRVPLTSDPALFRTLCRLGARLVALHLLEQAAPSLTKYPVKGSDRVESVRYTEPGAGASQGRVWINKDQYFEGVPPEVWAFHIGGYQPAEKWLKDRKGRKLEYTDLQHYARIIAALATTIRLMADIDAAIPGWPLA